MTDTRWTAGAAGAESDEPEVVTGHDEATEQVPCDAAAAEVDEQVEETIEEALARAEAKAAETWDRFVRLQAEWDNFRKRSAAERDAERIRANERLATNLLPVVDDLERALAHASETTDLNAFVEGIAAVKGKLVSVLEKEQVKAIDPVGEPFDALRHQAIGRKDDPQVPDETVADVFQKGYEMGGKVIRPAMVVVTTGGPVREKEPEPEGDGDITS
jgi:molecular chaperone GrpE